MANVAEAFVTLRPDTRGFGRDVESGLRGPTKSAGGSLGKVFGLAFAALAGTQVISKIGDTISAASDLNETVSKSNTVFGKAAQAVESWGETAAKTLGQSKRQALDAASGFGNMFDQLGIGRDVTAEMSMSMVELASDFASFHNADITQVLEAQAAAFRGEYDAVQRFVPTINAAAVEQQALAMGLAETSGELDAQDKALAAYELLIKGAGEATGDFARTSEGLANQQRIQAAQWEDLQGKIGKVFLPAATAATRFLNETLMPAFEKFGTHVAPVVSAAIATLGGWFSDLGETVRTWWDVSVKPRLEEFVAAVQVNWPKVESIMQSLGRVMDSIGNAFRTEMGLMSDRAEESGQDITGSVEAVLTVLERFAAAAARVSEAVAGAWNVLAGSLKRDNQQVQRGLDDLSGGAITRFQERIGRGIDNVISWFSQLPGRIISALGNLGSLLKSAGRAVLQGLWDGLREKWESVKDWVSSLGGKIKDLKGPLPEDKRLLTDEGRAIIQGLGRGMEDEWSAIERFLGTRTAEIPLNVAQPNFDVGSGRSMRPIELTLDLGEGVSRRIRIEQDRRDGQMLVGLRKGPR